MYNLLYSLCTYVHTPDWPVHMLCLCPSVTLWLCDRKELCGSLVSFRPVYNSEHYQLYWGYKNLNNQIWYFWLDTFYCWTNINFHKDQDSWTVLKENVKIIFLLKKIKWWNSRSWKMLLFKQQITVNKQLLTLKWRIGVLFWKICKHTNVRMKNLISLTLLIVNLKGMNLKNK